MITPELLDQLCFRIATISPQARTKLDTEQWRLGMEDNTVAEPHDVLRIMFENMMADATAIGIDFLVPVADIYSNLYDVELLVSALEWVFPNTLYPKLRKDRGLQAAIGRIVTGSIDNDDSLYSYLEFLGGGDASIGYKPDLNEAVIFTVKSIKGNSAFTAYLEHLLEEAKEEISVDGAYDINDLTGYHTAIVECVRALGIAQDHFLPTIDESLREKAKRRVYLASKELLAPDNLNSFGWLLTTDPLTLAKEDRAVYTRKRYLMLVGLKICPDYFKARSLPITPVDKFGIYTFLHAFEHIPLEDVESHTQA